MRTSQRHVITHLNPGKDDIITALITAYAKEKQYFLDFWSKNGPLLKKTRVIRDKLVKEGYTSANGLPARLWKLALIDAAETWDKYWKASFVIVRSALAKREDFTESQRHYSNWLLCTYTNFYAFKDGKAPVNPEITLTQTEINKTLRVLRKALQKACGKPPRVRLHRSVVLDANCYSTFVHNGIQYIEVMTLTPRSRVALPLLGNTAIKGNIRLVKDGQRMTIHQTHDVIGQPKASAKISQILAIDKGYTEVAVDQHGNHYGQNLGSRLADAADYRLELHRTRNKMNSKVKKLLAQNTPESRRKAKNINRFNLGKQQLTKEKHKINAHIENEVNRAFNELTAKFHTAAKPMEVVVEDLRHVFSSTDFPAVNRKLNAWVKGVIRDRLEFKAQAKGFRLTDVNGAYTSQMCPDCGYVEKANRKKDAFLCLKCGAKGLSDVFSARNILARREDREIHLNMPYTTVKVVLDQRYSSLHPEKVSE